MSFTTDDIIPAVTVTAANCHLGCRDSFNMITSGDYGFHCVVGSLLGIGGELDTAFQVIPGLFWHQIPQCTNPPVVRKQIRALVDDRYHAP